MKVVFTTAPSQEASAIAEALLKARLVGCANLIEGARSLYWWDGAIQDESETLILMETPDEHTEAVMKMLYDVHPYDAPKIVCLEPQRVNDAYLDWLNAETQTS